MKRLVNATIKRWNISSIISCNHDPLMVHFLSTKMVSLPIHHTWLAMPWMLLFVIQNAPIRPSWALTWPLMSCIPSKTLGSSTNNPVLHSFFSSKLQILSLVKRKILNVSFNAIHSKMIPKRFKFNNTKVSPCTFQHPYTLVFVCPQTNINLSRKSLFFVSLFSINLAYILSKASQFNQSIQIAETSMLNTKHY